MEYKACTIKGIEDLYLIGEDGSVFSKVRMRLLKQGESSLSHPAYSYMYVTICGTKDNKYYKRIAVHRLVAMAFIGPQPGPEYEVDHIDGNKKNNHYTNLQWITHQQNMVRARQRNRWKSGRKPGFTHSPETKHKMAIQKLKKVLLFNDTQDLIYKSVGDACAAQGINRRTFNRYANSNKTLNGFKIKVLSD